MGLKRENFLHSTIWVAIVILLQAVLLFFVSAEKEEYHIDEIYSYILSNSYETDRISNAESYWGQWVDGSSFLDFVEVDAGERFAYDKVYIHNGADCHPPLYYWLLHTVSSLFPNTFSKWLGLSINIVLFVFAQFLLYLLSAKMIKEPQFRILPVLMYGFSIMAIDTVLFIRMYMLLTVWVLLFTYLHFGAMENGYSSKRLLLIFITTYLGMMTQYYFIIYCFCATMVLFVSLWTKNRKKEMCKIALTECAAVTVMIISYPYVLSQAFGSSTNNVGNEVARTLLDFKLWIRQMISLGKQTIYPLGFNNLVTACLIALLTVIFILRICCVHKKGELKKWFFSAPVLLGVTWVLTYLLIAYIGGDYVYVRYLYFIFPLFYLLIGVLQERFFKNRERAKRWIPVIVALVVVCNTGLAMFCDRPAYLFKNVVEENKKLEAYRQDGLIVACAKKTASIPTGNFTKMASCSSVYLDTIDHIKDDHVLEGYLKDHTRCLLYVPTNAYWTKVQNTPEEIIQQLAPMHIRIQYTKCADGSLGEYYLIQKEM